MSKSNNNILLYGGLGLAAFMLLSNKSKSTSAQTSNTSTGTNELTGDPNDPYYYADVVYPAMLKANPNVGNPTYRLTDSEAQQYLNNYLDLQQALTGMSNARGIPLYDVARTHWIEHGVPEKRTFLRLQPPSMVPYAGVVESKKAGGGSWVTDALSIAGSVIAMLGVGLPQLNNREAEIVINGGAILTQILPMYKNDPLEPAINARLTTLLETYTDQD